MRKRRIEKRTESATVLYMQKLTLSVAAALLFLIGSPVYAQLQLEAVEVTPAETTATPEWSDYNVGDPGTTDSEDDTSEARTQQGRVLLDSDTNETAGTDRNVHDPGITILEASDGDPDRPVIVGGTDEETGGSRVVPSQTPVIVAPAAEDTETKESGEKAGTEDINIGVGELQETQNNETDLEFIRERAREVSVSRVEVRGWDPEKKEEILGDAREPADVRTGEDLERFTQRALLKDDAINAIETSTTSVSVKRRVPARLFGIFRTELEQEATITFGDGERGSRVKVKFPWLRIFYTVDDRFTVRRVEEVLLPETDDEVLVGFEQGDPAPQDQATVIQRILNAITG